MLLPLLLLSSLSSAAPDCHDVRLPVTLTATLPQFSYRPTASPVDTTNFFLQLTQPNSTWLRDLTTGNSTVSRNISLAATVCHPASGPGSTLQILTHGIGFDRSYWHFPYPSAADRTYSYVARALAAGHSTLAWDRPGIAASLPSPPLDAVNEAQLLLQVAALEKIADLATSPNSSAILFPSSSFSSSNTSSSSSSSPFQNIILVGHSFGSVMTYTLSARRPDLAAAIILTGFSQSPEYMPLFALGANFAPLPSPSSPDYPPGYVAPKAPLVGLHTDFFAPHDFDPALLARLASDCPDAGTQPAALGELLTVGGGAADKSPFAGHVLVVTGERDLPFCGGNCHNGDILELSRPMFPNASSFNATVIPGAGHGLNLGYSHNVAYDTMLDFVKSFES